MGSTILKVGRYAVLALILTLVMRHILVNWDAVAESRGLQPGWLALGSVLGLIGLCGFAWASQLLVSAHGHRVPYQVAIGLFFVPLLGKYIPGKIWSVFGALWVYGREGISKSVAALCMGMGMTLGYLSAILVVLSMGAVGRVPFVGTRAAGLAAFALLVLVHPAVSYRIVNGTLRILGRDPIPHTLSFSAFLRLLIVDTLAWLIYGAGFVLLVWSVVGPSMATAPRMIALFALAQVLGFVVLFAPSGIGVREGVFLLGLSPLLGEGPAIVITGLCRVWQTALELLLSGIGWKALGRANPDD